MIYEVLMYLGVGMVIMAACVIMGMVIYSAIEWMRGPSKTLLTKRIMELEETITELRQTIEQKDEIIYNFVADECVVQTKLVGLGITMYDARGHLSTPTMVEELIKKKDYAIRELCLLLREQTEQHIRGSKQ